MYDRLLAHHGPQGWWPGDGPFETIVGAILTQNTAWTNATRAIDNLKAAGAMSPAALRAMPEEALAEIVRPSGYFNAKARKLKAMGDFLGRYGDSIEPWRTAWNRRRCAPSCLAVHGIGPETADDIVLYVAGLPSFVMDVYTQRIVDRMLPRHGLRGYDAYQALFERHLPHEAAALQRVPRAAGRPRQGRMHEARASMRVLCPLRPLRYRADVPRSERMFLCVYS